MLNKEIQLIDDLKDFLLCNSSYKKKEIYSINNLLHHYVNVRKNLSEFNQQSLKRRPRETLARNKTKY